MAHGKRAELTNGDSSLQDTPKEPSGFDFRRNIPQLDREQRKLLVERFRKDAQWNTDFVVMMSFSAALASMGLLQSSVAVVIGAMLVAPLMSPLLGAGFALVQGNFELFLNSLKAMSYGVLMALVIAMCVGGMTPNYEPTLELQSRGNVDLLDLGVALASGMVAAYAMARPNVAGTLAGVAIAAALVPPLAVVGIALVQGGFLLSGAAVALFLTNNVAIILGAAIVFRTLGVGASVAVHGLPSWAARLIILLAMGSVVLVWPLGERLVAQSRMGQDRPLINPLSLEVRKAIRAKVATMDGFEIMLAGRAGAEPESGVHVLMTSRRTATSADRDGMADVIRAIVGESVPVRVVIVRNAFESGTESAAEASEPPKAKADSVSE